MNLPDIHDRRDEGSVSPEILLTCVGLELYNCQLHLYIHGRRTRTI